MIVPLVDDLEMDRLPWVNWILIASICTVSVTGFYKTEFFDDLAGYRYQPPGPKPSTFQELQQAVRNGSLFRDRESRPQRIEHAPLLKLPLLFVTSSFVHVNVWQLLANTYFLFTFGNAVNYKLGHRLFLALYLAAALLNGIASYLLLAGSPAIGASGAIMGVVGAFLVFFPRNDFRIPFQYVDEDSWWMWWRDDEEQESTIPACVMILIWFAVDFLCVLWVSSSGIGYIGHLLAFLFGFVSAFVLAWRKIVEPTRSEQTLLQVFGRD